MPFLIGQCCIDQIVTPPDAGSSDVSGKNEIIPFSSTSSLTIPWNNTRKARFGNAAVIQVEIAGPDGKYRITNVEVVPNDPVNTTSYAIDLGGPADGRIIIS